MGKQGQHHTEVFIIRKTIKAAVRKAKNVKQASCQTFHHSFATRHPKDGYDIRTVRELSGHKDVKTMIYTQVLNVGGKGIRSPCRSP